MPRRIRRGLPLRGHGGIRKQTWGPGNDETCPGPTAFMVDWPEGPSLDEIKCRWNGFSEPVLPITGFAPVVGESDYSQLCLCQVIEDLKGEPLDGLRADNRLAIPTGKHRSHVWPVKDMVNSVGYCAQEDRTQPRLLLLIPSGGFEELSLCFWMDVLAQPHSH